MKSRRGKLNTTLDLDIIGISPFARPDSGLVLALCRAGALGVLDLGCDPQRARKTMDELARRAPAGFGILVRSGLEIDATDLPAAVTLVVLEAGAALDPWRGRTTLVQVTSLDEARGAAADGATGLIAKGSEGGGRVGEETSFVLLQEIAGALDLPVWVQGGVGLYTAAACIAGGARGVVLDSQLALVRESDLDRSVRAAVASMDGSETIVLDGHRVFSRPDLPMESWRDLAPGKVAGLLGADDLERELLPAGQDAAFASELARRFHTAGGVVQAVRESMDRSLRAAKRHEPLAPGAGLAEAHGIRCPIAQGPMTRVSDRVEFADEVSKAGALPFLALSMMRGDAARELLQATKERLGRRSWGVGILGFVPEELRAEQLAAIEEARPAVAIIAGGRPSQARPLEAKGITTYLHVPSPGLLELFLADGARHFVFEGRECGGHVGPRTSFVLWESQIERLMRLDDAGELRILFAGGIHDARSAAMVAALSGRLVERGARVGVLMGTAYLFTREAVKSGAIRQGFQDAAVSCTRTVLLETAPGHATRCAESPYVHAFTAEKARLEAEQGRSGSAVWEALERLNLGRLRIASKGLERAGDELVVVDEATERREGMYMIGQVAGLRDGVCTLEELHDDVTTGATRRLAGLRLGRRRGRRSPPPVDVAVIGIACIYPGAPDTETFWSNIVSGVNSITEVPEERWSTETYYDPQAKGGGKTPSKWGGFLPDVVFDPLRYGLPPRALGSIEPTQLLSLEVARRAIEDAGYGEREFDRRRTSVIFGAEAGTDLSSAYGFRALYPQYLGQMPPELDAHLPKLSEDSFPGVLANVISGRIANRLDLGGVNYTVDAACAASLAAVDLAVKELRDGTSDMVLCGGADLHNSVNDYLMFSSVHALSPTGQCRTFDAGADGITLGEGVACVVLKRLEDAEREGDRVYAVIKGIAGSSDGRCLGLTAPREEGQALALERAYRRARISPAEVGLVEAHGTGTVVGDRTELGTLTRIYGAAGARPRSCALGSVKSQIGHTKCAAGLAGLIKVALSLHRRVLPPTMNIRQPNPAYDGENPFTLSNVSRPWPSDDRKAAASAFGFGGTNFHAVLEAYDGAELPASGLPQWPAELFLFRGSTADEALAEVQRVERVLDTAVGFRLRDLAYTLAASSSAPVQLAVVAGDAAELKARLIQARSEGRDTEGVFRAGGPQGKLAFLFPGQGSQRPGMLRELFIAFPRLQRYSQRGRRYLEAMFPPTAWSSAERHEQSAAITDTRVAQPALGIAGLAVSGLLNSLGVRPDMAGGHSYGELVALCVAGSIAERDLIDLSRVRAECILSAAGEDPGTMAAVAAGPEAILAALNGHNGVVIANQNAPRQTVISGATAAVQSALSRLREAGLGARSIPVACAFHSPVVAGAGKRFLKHLKRVSLSPPAIPVWSNTTAEPYPAAPEAIRERLAEHLARPVRFASQIESMYGAGARVFVEAGPGRVLSSLVKRILGDRPHLTIACSPNERSGLRELLSAVGHLAACGVALDPSALFAGRDAQILDLDAVAADQHSATAWIVNGHRARPISGELPQGALRPASEAPLVTAATPSGPRDAATIEYLRNMRELAAAQKDVLLGLIGRQEALLGSSSDAPVEPEAVEPARPAASEPPAEAVGDALLRIVSKKTGYPVEMLGLDLDLEAELSIDSIKRVEILGALGEGTGFGVEDEADRDAVIEELAARKTLREIIEWLEQREARSEAPMEPENAREPEREAASPVVRRYVLDVQELPGAVRNGAVLDKRRFAVTDDGRGVSGHLTRLLEREGATVRLLGPGEGPDGADGLIHLGALAPETDDEPVKDLFALAREAVLGGAKWVVGVTGVGGVFGHRANGKKRPRYGGTAGLLKSLAKECPDVRVHAIDVDPRTRAEEVARLLVDELLADDGPLEVGYHDGIRHKLTAVTAETNGNTKTAPLALDAGSVVLVTGGARGITARFSRELARRYQCRLEIVGRSPEPGEDDPRLAGATDLPSLRRLILERGETREPGEIEALCQRILRAREIRDTLSALRDAGSEVRYHALDVGDPRAFGALIDEIYGRQGRIDGVVHGAGVIEDKLLRQKTRESFDRVYDTKVVAARTLASRLRDDVRFVVFFSSVSGAFGNRGQIDYAAANDAIDKLALELNERIRARVVSINWGPWAGSGMVSPELERDYARRGIGLIPPASGVARLLDELRHDTADGQVILMCAEPSSLN